MKKIAFLIILLFSISQAQDYQKYFSEDIQDPSGQVYTYHIAKDLRYNFSEKTGTLYIESWKDSTYANDTTGTYTPVVWSTDFTTLPADSNTIKDFIEMVFEADDIVNKINSGKIKD